MEQTNGMKKCTTVLQTIVTTQFVVNFKQRRRKIGGGSKSENNYIHDIQRGGWGGGGGGGGGGYRAFVARLVFLLHVRLGRWGVR